jgi:hypothetical protein
MCALLVWWVTLTYGYVWGLVWFVQGVPSLVLPLMGDKLAAGTVSRCSPVRIRSNVSNAFTPREASQSRRLPASVPVYTLPSGVATW